MATVQQIDANRRNAQRSTGPRTPRGKATSSRNATRHGIHSTSPVIPNVESSEAWEQHRASTIDGLAPHGPLQEALAERVALILWRLGRVARYERNITIQSQQQPPNDLLAALTGDPAAAAERNLAEVRTQFADARQTLRALTTLAQLRPDVPISGQDANAVLEAIAEQLDHFDLNTFSAPDIIPDEVAYEDIPDWTAERLDRLIQTIAEENDRHADQLRAAALAEARRRHNEVRAAYDRLRRRSPPQNTKMRKRTQFARSALRVAPMRWTTCDPEKARYDHQIATLFHAGTTVCHAGMATHDRHTATSDLPLSRRGEAAQTGESPQTRGPALGGGQPGGRG